MLWRSSGYATRRTWRCFSSVSGHGGNQLLKSRKLLRRGWICGSTSVTCSTYISSSGAKLLEGATYVVCAPDVDACGSELPYVSVFHTRLHSGSWRSLFVFSTNSASLRESASWNQEALVSRSHSGNHWNLYLHPKLRDHQIYFNIVTSVEHSRSVSDLTTKT